ncbi:MAG: hypothetical protein EOM11_08275 [Erysipelotrichia bacterium]|nr:hypothetical protein [Erysipelotrichia bacterium]
MLVLKIHGKDYLFKNEWKDISIRDAINFINVEQPPEHKELIDILTQIGIKEYLRLYKKKSAAVKNKILPGYYRSLLKTLSDIPDEVLENIIPSEYELFYNSYIINLHLCLLVKDDLLHENITHFDFNGDRYYLPHVGRFVNGQAKYGIDMFTMQFTETADLLVNADNLENGYMESLPYMIAILCRKSSDEKYNEDEIMRRADMFLDLNMDVAFSVNFFLLRCLRVLKPIIPSFSQVETSKQVLQQQIPA